MAKGKATFCHFLLHLIEEYNNADPKGIILQNITTYLWLRLTDEFKQGWSLDGDDFTGLVNFTEFFEERIKKQIFPVLHSLWHELKEPTKEFWRNFHEKCIQEYALQIVSQHPQ